MRYTTKPFEIEAVQFLGIATNEAEIESFGAKIQVMDETLREATTVRGVTEKLQISRLQVWDYLQETWVNVNDFDYIIKGMKNEFYPCAAKVFEAKYRPIGKTPEEAENDRRTFED